MPTDELSPATFEQLPDRVKLFTINEATENGVRHLFKLFTQHLDLTPDPLDRAQLILIDTRGALLPVLVTFDELRIMYGRYQPPRSRVAALVRVNSLLLNAMQLVMVAINSYQRNAVVDVFDIEQRQQAINWLTSDEPSHTKFGI